MMSQQYGFILMNELAEIMGYEYHLSVYNKHLEAVWIAHKGSTMIWYADLPDESEDGLLYEEWLIP
jgi:hypothetical protein